MARPRPKLLQPVFDAIGFLPSPEGATGITISNDERNLVNNLAALIKEGSNDKVQDYHVSLDVNISWRSQGERLTSSIPQA
jgi:hypothetical protein